MNPDNLIRLTLTTRNPDMALSIQDWIIRHYPVKEIKFEQYNGKTWTRVNSFENPPDDPSLNS